MKSNKKIWTIIAIVIAFMAISLAYFSPIFEGRVLQQHDVLTYYGMSQEINQFEDETGEFSEWTNSMFGGMPTWLIKASNISVLTAFNYIFPLNRECPWMMVFMYCLFAFAAFLLLDVSIPISFFGALAYGLSSYLFIIIEAGHITKAFALAYMPAVVAGLYAAYNGKKYVGSAFFALFLGLQLKANHLQIVYYTAMFLGLYVLIKLVETLRKKTFAKEFLQPSLILLVGVVLAVFSNFTNIYYTLDYTENSTRGKSELIADVDNQTSGLDKDYATAWSYDIDETLNLIVPGSKGGASSMALDKNSQFYQELENRGIARSERDQIVKNLPVYWGTQPFTSGPVYLGIVAFFLFLCGVVTMKNNLKWWLLSATILSIFLAWGHNMMWFTDLFLDYFPGYNKFRTVSMILVIAEVTIPLMAIFALKNFVDNVHDEAYFKKLTYTTISLIGLFVVCLLTAGAYDYSAESDQQMLAAGYPNFLVEALRADRKSMYTGDLWRSIFFVVLTFGLMYLYKLNKIKSNTLVYAIALLTLVDMYPVNKRYLNDDDFSRPKSKVSKFIPTEADLEILKDTSLDYRVMNLTVSTFNDVSTSYFHKSIGGYHGAKMQRYQELADHYISKLNMNVLNMLNTKYFITRNRKTNQYEVQKNPEAYGNAWFVENIKMVDNANEEIAMLDSVSTRRTAIVDKRFENFVTQNSYSTNGSTISLKSYAPNHLIYETNCSQNQFAVFSEIYYPKYWHITIDGKDAEMCRADYVLRAMNIPEGQHTIEFKFHSPMIFWGNVISMIASAIIVGALILFTILECRKQKSVVK